VRPLPEFLVGVAPDQQDGLNIKSESHDHAQVNRSSAQLQGEARTKTALVSACVHMLSYGVLYGFAQGEPRVWADGARYQLNSLFLKWREAALHFVLFELSHAHDASKRLGQMAS